MNETSAVQNDPSRIIETWQKKRWNQADIVSKLTLHDKQDVYRRLKDLESISYETVNLLEACMQQIPEAIEQTRKFLKEPKPPPEIKVVSEDQVIQLPKKANGKRQPPETPAEKLRLAMWFIDMFPSPQEAMDAVKIAANAVEKL